MITVDTILDRESQAFEDDLLFAINLMQEKFHDCHVYDVNAKPEDYLKINHLDWEIFPAGSVDRVVSILVEKTRDMTPQKKDQIQDRAEFFNSLNPEQGIIKGSSMGGHYLGAKFSDTLVAFENIDYGNAIYILFDNWEDLSKMSRTEILQRPQKDYIRIPHKGLWKGRVRYEISQRRK